MLKVLTAAQMREVDRLTTERYGIPSILLMENAAFAVVGVVTAKLGGSVEGKNALVLCGKGNNAGDGFAVARILRYYGCNVTVCMLYPDSEISGDAAENLRILRQLHANQSPGSEPNLCFAEAGTYRSFFDSITPFFGPDVVVDAIFGTGLTRPVTGEVEDVICSYNSIRSESERPLYVSIDLPSGLGSDSGEWDGEAFAADVTVTFTRPKPANVLPPSSRNCGELFVVNIGSPAELIKEQPSKLYLADNAAASTWLDASKFTNASYKNKRGHALIIGGSRNYSGAAVLAGNAAIRSGVGLVTIATPEDSRDGVIGRVSPEVMVRGLSQTPEGSAAEKAADEIAEFLKNVDAVAVGSGLSAKEVETKAFIRRIVEERQTPVVIDADGLTALSPWDVNGVKIGDDSGGAGEPPAVQSMPLILTPHEGEFKKLLGVDGDEANEILNDRVQAVRDFATRHNVILVLKGERALIGAPDGRVVVNPTGNSGLGKAGNGDTLTGIIAGFVAQAVQMNIDMFETVVAAVYIAGMAGDVAAKKYGKRVMTASDVRDCLVEVFEELSNAEN